MWKVNCINMTRAWDKAKIWVPDRNRTHDLSNTERASTELWELMESKTKSGKIEIIEHGWFNTVEGCKKRLGSLWSQRYFYFMKSKENLLKTYQSCWTSEKDDLLVVIYVQMMYKNKNKRLPSSPKFEISAPGANLRISGMFLGRSHFFIIIIEKIRKSTQALHRLCLL